MKSKLFFISLLSVFTVLFFGSNAFAANTFVVTSDWRTDHFEENANWKPEVLLNITDRNSDGALDYLYQQEQEIKRTEVLSRTVTIYDSSTNAVVNQYQEFQYLQPVVYKNFSQYWIDGYYQVQYYTEVQNGAIFPQVSQKTIGDLNGNGIPEIEQTISEYQSIFYRNYKDVAKFENNTQVSFQPHVLVSTSQFDQLINRYSTIIYR